jgi:cell division protein FtsQ
VKRPEGFDAPQRAPQATGNESKRAATHRNRVREPAPLGRPAGPGPGTKSAPRVRASKPDPVARTEKRVQRAEVRRFTRNSRRRRATWFTVLGLVLVMIAVLLVAVFSPILALRTIEVDGVSAIPAATVQKALSSQLGTPLALLSDQTVRSKLSRIILIRSYTTEIVPPNTLVVRIVEREAIAVIPDGNGYDQVDPAGVVLRKSATPAGLPLIDIGRSGVDSAGFAAAVKVLLAMPSSMLSQVKSISATTLDNVSLTLNQGNHTILWGSSAQSDLKARTLATLLKTCAAEPVLNVTAPLALACGPVQKPPTPTPTATSKP